LHLVSFQHAAAGTALNLSVQAAPTGFVREPHGLAAASQIAPLVTPLQQSQKPGVQRLTFLCQAVLVAQRSLQVNRLPKYALIHQKLQSVGQYVGGYRQLLVELVEPGKSVK